MGQDKEAEVTAVDVKLVEPVVISVELAVVVGDEEGEVVEVGEDETVELIVLLGLVL